MSEHTWAPAMPPRELCERLLHIVHLIAEHAGLDRIEAATLNLPDNVGGQLYELVTAGEQLEQDRDAYGPLVEDLNKTMDQVMALREQLRRAWRPWPPDGPERKVEAISLTEDEDRFERFCPMSTETWSGEDLWVLYRELEEPKPSKDSAR